jgi:hypothetical protein
VAELLGVELIEIVFHFEQAAAERAGVSVLPGVLPAPAGFFNALEISARHGILKRSGYNH